MPVSPARTSRCLDSYQALTALPTTDGHRPGDRGVPGPAAREPGSAPRRTLTPTGRLESPRPASPPASTTISAQAARRVRSRPGDPGVGPGSALRAGGRGTGLPGDPSPAAEGVLLPGEDPGRREGGQSGGRAGTPGKGRGPGPDPAAARRRLLTGAVPSGAGAPRADSPRLPPTSSEAPARAARTPNRTRSRGRRARTPQRRAPGAWTAAGPGRPLPAQNSTGNPRVGAREGIRENQNWRPYVQAFRPAAAAAAATKRSQTLEGVEVAARGAGPGGVRGAGAPRRRPHPFPPLPWRRPASGAPPGRGRGLPHSRSPPPPAPLGGVVMTTSGSLCSL